MASHFSASKVSQQLSVIKEKVVFGLNYLLGIDVQIQTILAAFDFTGQ